MITFRRLFIALLFIHYTNCQRAESYDTSDWIPISKPTEKTEGVKSRKAEARVLNINDEDDRNFFPENQKYRPQPKQYLTVPPPTNNQPLALPLRSNHPYKFEEPLNIPIQTIPNQNIPLPIQKQENIRYYPTSPESNVPQLLQYQGNLFPTQSGVPQILQFPTAQYAQQPQIINQLLAQNGQVLVPQEYLQQQILQEQVQEAYKQNQDNLKKLENKLQLKNNTNEEKQNVQLVYVPLENLNQNYQPIYNQNIQKQIEEDKKQRINNHNFNINNDNLNLKAQYIEDKPISIANTKLTTENQQYLVGNHQYTPTKIENLNNQQYIIDNNQYKPSTVNNNKETIGSLSNHQYVIENNQYKPTTIVSNNKQITENLKEYLTNTESAKQNNKILPQGIQNDFIQQALDAHKLQQQFKEGNFKPEVSTVTPRQAPTTTKKRKAHQPPLAVYMDDQSGTSTLSDVLDLLKTSKSIAVHDSFGPDSPQVFVGPSNLNPPDHYVKFELPYLNSIDTNRLERKVEQLPFFVAPLSYKTPSGYAKIPLPSPHVGSVVVNELLTTQKPSKQKPYSSTIKPVVETTQKIEYTRANPFSQTINHYELEQINNQFASTYRNPTVPPSSTIRQSQQIYKTQPDQTKLYKSQAVEPQFDTIPQQHHRFSSTTIASAKKIKNNPERLQIPSNKYQPLIDEYNKHTSEKTIPKYEELYVTKEEAKQYKELNLEPGRTYEFIELPSVKSTTGKPVSSTPKYQYYNEESSTGKKERTRQRVPTVSPSISDDIQLGQYLIETTNRNVVPPKSTLKNEPQKQQKQQYLVENKSKEDEQYLVENTNVKSESGEVLPSLINNLQDHHLRSLLVPALIAPTTEQNVKPLKYVVKNQQLYQIQNSGSTGKYQVPETVSLVSNYQPSAVASTPKQKNTENVEYSTRGTDFEYVKDVSTENYDSYSPKYVVSSTPSPQYVATPTPGVYSSTHRPSPTTESEVETTTRSRIRTRQRGGSRYGSASSTTVAPRRTPPRTRRTTTIRPRTTTQHYHTQTERRTSEYHNKEEQPDTVRQRFRTRGRPVKTESSEKTQTVDVVPKTSDQSEETLQFKQPQLLGGFQVSEELPQRNAYIKYVPVDEDGVVVTAEPYNAEKNTYIVQSSTAKQSNLENYETPIITEAKGTNEEYVRYSANVEAPKTETTTSPVKIRTRIRGRRPTTTVKTTTTTQKPKTKEADEKEEFYGFFRQPNFPKSTTQKTVKETEEEEVVPNQKTIEYDRTPVVYEPRPQIYNNRQNVQFIKQTSPGVEYIRSTSPRVEYIQNTNPRVEYVQNTSPKVQYVQNTSPRVEYVQNTSPRVQYIQSSTPKIEYVQSSTPYDRNTRPTIVYEANSPQYDNVSPVTFDASSKSDEEYIREPLYSGPVSTSSSKAALEEGVQIYTNDGQVSSTPVQFIGELRPKYSTTTVPSSTTQYYTVKTTSTQAQDVPKTRTRSRVRIPSTRSKINSDESSTTAKTRGNVRTRGRTHYKPPQTYQNEGKQEEEEVEGGNYPPGYVKGQPLQTQRPSFQITIEPENVVNEDQEPYSSIFRPKYLPNPLNVLNTDAITVTPVNDVSSSSFASVSKEGGTTQSFLIVTTDESRLESITEPELQLVLAPQQESLVLNENKDDLKQGEEGTTQDDNVKIAFKDNSELKPIEITFNSNRNKYDEQNKPTETSPGVFQQPITVLDDLTTSSSVPESTTVQKIKSRRRGVWRKVKRPVVDNFEIAESQNFGTVYLNSFSTAEDQKTNDKPLSKLQENEDKSNSFGENQFSNFEKSLENVEEQPNFYKPNNSDETTENKSKNVEEVKPNFDIIINNNANSFNKDIETPNQNKQLNTKYDDLETSNFDEIKDFSDKNKPINQSDQKESIGVQKSTTNSEETLTSAQEDIQTPKDDVPKGEAGNFFDAIYEMFGLSQNKTEATQKNNDNFENNKDSSKADEESSQNQEDTSITESSVPNTIPEVHKMLSWDDLGVVKTSTSTEVSHETEICYRGRCIRSTSERIPTS